ncbi:MAG: phenylalanine--tRNA ligase subunit beta [Nitrospirae bacterium]|nr:phenylalanine--tRNA ligase subunit beta [Nitrospirota bacterium]
MRVPFEWLKEFLDISSGPEEVADILTMIGLEVEGTERFADDVVFEVNVTPNRPDCLSIIGIARELSAALNVSLKYPEYEISEKRLTHDFKIEILNDNLCHRYAGRIIKGIKVEDSPEWLKNRISKCGIRAINNVVDITNYVLLEFGHPLHAFDLNTLSGNTIRVNTGGQDNEIVTLDRVERKLPPDALLIWDAENPIAIAGIMGGADTEVTDSTNDIFLESAYFEPRAIRRTSKALGLKSESSYRFERGTDIEFLITALDRAAFLIKQIAGGTVYKENDVYPKRFVPVSIDVGYGKVNRTLDIDVSDTEMVDIIKRLGINADTGPDSFRVSPPSFRLDLKIEADIIEEIARIYGYHRIKTTVPKAVISAGNSDRKRNSLLRIRDTIMRAGFSEAINYSFMNEAELDLLDIPSGDRRRKTIAIKNPLRKEESLLRTTLIPSLIKDFIYNFSRGINDIKIFEVSRVFEDIGRPLPIEISYLSGIYYKEKIPSLWKEAADSFYLVKGAIESLFDDLHIKGFAFSPSHEPFLHPGQSCDIRVAGSCIGFLGSLSPLITEKLDLKVPKLEIIVFEMDVDRLISMIPMSLEFSLLPKFPYVERDIAIIMDDTLLASDVENLVRAYPSELIEDVSIFDLYKGKNIPEGKKSLALAIRYRSRNRTLTEAEVEELHSNVVRYITAETGGELRV